MQAVASKAAKSHASAAGKKTRYDVGVGEDMPYQDLTFDAVVCVDGGVTQANVAEVAAMGADPVDPAHAEQLVLVAPPTTSHPCRLRHSP